MKMEVWTKINPPSESETNPLPKCPSPDSIEWTMHKLPQHIYITLYFSWVGLHVWLRIMSVKVKIWYYITHIWQQKTDLWSMHISYSYASHMTCHLKAQDLKRFANGLIRKYNWSVWISLYFTLARPGVWPKQHALFKVFWFSVFCILYTEYLLFFIKLDNPFMVCPNMGVILWGFGQIWVHPILPNSYIATPYLQWSIRGNIYTLSQFLKFNQIT